MAHERKNFNYKTSTLGDVYAHFLTSSRQAIASARKCWIDDAAVTAKLDAAFYMCKLADLRNSYPKEYKSFTLTG